MTMEIIVCENEDLVAEKASKKLATVLQNKKNPVLGLATGSTPIKTYKKLVEIVSESKELQKKLAKLMTLNLDEYVGIDEKNPQSYRSFMDENLFKSLSEIGNLDLKNTHIPNGNAKDLLAECERFERLVQKNNPDLWLLGIGPITEGGSNRFKEEVSGGHIAFNEEGTPFKSETHVVDLHKSTINANSRFFTEGEFQPEQAITTGISTIFRAKTILLLATGKNKSGIIKRAIEGSVSTDCPASFLQEHPSVTFILDKDAASELSIQTREKVLLSMNG